MPLKRKIEDKVANARTSTQRKKMRVDEARKISVQFANPKPNTRNSATSSMEGLPSTIDVEKIVEARAFEINAMQKAMDDVASAGTSRVWQSLPRHLRRRAASHDVRRVPVRLRQKARAEMDTPAKPSSKKKIPKQGNEKRLTRTEEFMSRQRDKTWLETHIWHAKRMHMENMWGYRLAKTPTEKSFRPFHRAALHGCILHDASYEAIIELSGSEETLKAILSSCSDPQAVNPGAVRFTNGSRVCYTHMYKPKSYPFDLIGPAEILWKANAAVSSTPLDPAVAKKKDKQRQAPSNRVLWIRCHPIIYDTVISTIKSCVQSYLQVAQSTSKKEIEVEVADLRDQFNIFELLGPKSSQVIHGALTPVKGEDRDEFKTFWKAFGQVQTAGSVPRGMIIGFKVLDPRLNFPPKNTKVLIDENGNLNASLPEGLWPTSRLAASEIWNDDLRARLGEPRYKKKDIDSRKAKHLVPGSQLNPLRQDNRVPVLLIQRSIEAQAPVSSSLSFSQATTLLQPQAASSRSLHGWTLVIPKGWGMPFFSSLTHTGTRVGGQEEITTQRFEAGCSMFPKDYPCTDAYTKCTEERGKEERERWERKPPAKRPNWEKLGTENPWVPDWESLVGLRKEREKEKSFGNSEDPDLVPTQREPYETSMDVDVDVDADANKQDQGSNPSTGNDIVPEIYPWLFRGPETLSTIELLTHLPDPAPILLAKLDSWRAKRSLPTLTYPADSLLRSALVSVRLSIPRSGDPEDNAIIYKMDDEEANKWRLLVGHDNYDTETRGELRKTELSELKYSKADIIGYVTSGHFSLSIGHGQALGAVELTSYLGLKDQLYRLKNPNALPLVKIRNKHSPKCRAAFVELIS